MPEAKCWESGANCTPLCCWWGVGFPSAVAARRHNRIPTDSAEDHLPSAGLQNAGHGEFGILAKMAAALFHDYHRAVLQIPHALAGFFPRLLQADGHPFTGQYH